MNTKKYVAKTLKGLESVLNDELKDLGVSKTRVLTRAVEFEANKEQLYKVNYSVRTALSILQPLFSFNALNEREFYKKIKEFPWYKIMRLNQTFLISKSVNSEVFTHSHYISLKMKDAIVDKFREERGERPNINTDKPDFRFHLKINGTKCSVSLDTSGEALFKRGYKTGINKAPINECLASGLIHLMGWNGTSALLDPTCGSGTIVIEAAMIANKIPSGFYRKHFGFMNFKDFDSRLWQKVKEEKNKEINFSGVKIYGYDINEKTIRIARANLDNLGELKRHIRLKKDDATSAYQPFETYTVLFNPPYGERLNEKYEVEKLYAEIFDNLKRNFKNTQIGIISSNDSALNCINLPLKKSVKVLNGALDCQFNIYQT